MRRYAALGLLAIAGCNEIWGLSRDVDLRDSGVDPAFPRVKLTAQIALTKPDGYADPEPADGPLDPAPEVKIGPLDGDLETAVYEPDGAVRYPVAFTGATWRLVYTLADRIPREVQWSPPEGDRVGHLVEPLLGRLDRKPVPAGGGYSITPIGSPAQHTSTRVFTTGIWTEGAVALPPAGAKFDYDFDMKAVSLSGPRGAPEKDRADHAVLVDFQNAGGCRYATGAAAFVVPDMTPNGLTAPDPQPQYYGVGAEVELTFGGPSLIESRLQDVLDTRFAGTNLRRMAYGYVPSLGVSGFLRPVPVPALDFLLPGPGMLTFLNCTLPSTAPFTSVTFADPPDLRDRFPHVVHVEVANQRTLGSVTLTSGFSAVVASSTYAFTSEFLVAAPTKLTLSRGAGSLDLDKGADGSVLPAGTDPLELRFEVESDPGLVADSFEVTLHEVMNDRLEQRRIFTVAERKVRIDASLLAPSREYVFEVRAYRGRPESSRANFAINTYPQYAATIFSRTFRTP
jgi:hypothetical protein